jgi:hypothetical protein
METLNKNTSNIQSGFDDAIKSYEDSINSGDYEKAFESSIKLAEASGVDSSKILRSKEDIDNFFMAKI